MSNVRLRFTGMLSENKKGQIWVQDPFSGNYHELDEVGGTICRLLKKPLQFEELVDALVNEYEVERQQCEADVMPFLVKLQANGLLREEQA